MTQAELAERAGLSVKAISALESGRRQRPYPSTVRALADALGLSEVERSQIVGSTPARRKAPADVSTTPLSLPGSPTPIIGREHELAKIEALLRGGAVRMITLTGPGGVGKSRLALELAAVLPGDVVGQVAFVSLAPLRDSTLVLAAIAQTIGMEDSRGALVGRVLAARIGADPWLLVLDNMEHLLDAAPDLAALLSNCPELRMLVTSRAPLRIRAEHEYPLRPLALPDLSRVPTLADVEHISSVRLFLERARAAVPQFELTQANCAAVAAICRRLDGLPLALELVAARLRVLRPTELLARLEDVLPLLVGGSRDLPERQQTMQAAINWSYELLRPVEQALFRRLSVFAGGWTLDAAEQVTAWSEISADEVFDLLSGVVEQSLVVAEAREDESTRYRMLEPIRQFASRRVDDAGETETLSRRHLAWCLALAEEGQKQFHSPAQRFWLNRLEEEHDNIRTALDWSHLNPERKALELQLAASLWPFWETRGHLTEGRRRLELALTDSDDAPTDLRAEALNAAGNLALDQGDRSQSVELHEASLELRRALGDRYGIAQSLLNLGNVLLDQGRYEQASDHYAESLALFREIGSDWDIANALNNMGITLGYLGEYSRAAELLEEALSLRASAGEAAYRARSLDALAVVLQRMGDLDRAEALHRESLTLRRELNDVRGVAVTLRNLGRVVRYRGDYTEATRHIEESLQIRHTLEDRFGVAMTLGALADLVRLQGERDRAVALYLKAMATQVELDVSEGLAETLLGLAAIAQEDQDGHRAATLLGASDRMRDATSRSVSPIDKLEYESLVDAIKSSMSSAEFCAAIDAGRNMSTDQAVTFAQAMTGKGTQPRPVK